MDMSQYITLFLEESKENLQNLNDNLLILEKDPSNEDTINEIFRVAHTLKGMSATMGFTEMSNLTHKMENVLESFRSGEVEINSNIVSLLFECLDMLSLMVDDISEGNTENHDTSDLVQRLHRITQEDEVALTKAEEELEGIGLNEYERTVIENAKEGEYFIYHIKVELSKECLIKSARAYLVIKTLEEKGEIIKSLPSIEKIEEEEFDFSFELVFITKESKEMVREAIEGISEIKDVFVEKMSLDEKEKSQEDKLQGIVQGQAANKKDNEKTNQSFTNKGKLNQSVRVDLQRLDNFMNLVSELVINRTRLEQISSNHKQKDLHETLEQVARITTDLQDLVLKIRMLPIDRVFNRFPRMVRDLSKELNKEIDLVIKGKETELDRTVIDELGDPLVHLIRNAVDHGIESKEERIKKGKDPKGTVKMIAYQEGNKAIIRIEDDGKGINPEVIRKKAIEKEIPVEDLNNEELINLIFNQGFSTNDEVTDVSGRGVGMDVVKKKISSLGGSINLRSEVDKGSTFIIHLPLTLSIIQALLVKVAEETFAISLGFIEKVVSISPGDIKSSHKGNVFIYRGQTIPVIRVNEKLNLSSKNLEEEYLIIVKVGEKLSGLIVDDLMGQQEIVIKPLGNSLKEVKEYVGATILGDGLVTLILDAGAMI